MIQSMQAGNMSDQFDTIIYDEDIPTVDEYLALRQSVDFSPRSREAAEKGLPGSQFCVVARTENKLVGMARLVGDGGCSFLVVDVIVIPEMQGRGIGAGMMRRMDKWIDANVPPTGMISMMADEPGRKLYERYGFKYTAPESLGMKRFVGKIQRRST